MFSDKNKRIQSPKEWQSATNARVPKIEFGNNLRTLRETEKLKQSELAEKLGVTQRKVSYWETGKIEPSLADLWKIADFFNVSVDELIGRTKY